MNETVQSEENNCENDIKKSKKKHIAGVFFLFVMTAAVLYALLSANDLNEVLDAMTSASGVDLTYAIICLAAYVILGPASMCVLCKAKKVKTSNVQSYLIGASEPFFNNITPYQTGAQPFQVYSFSKAGMTAAEGTGLVICNYIAYLVALNILIICSLIYSKDFFGSFSKDNMVWIPVLGIIMNLFTLVMFFCMVTCKWVRDGFKKFLRWLCKFNWLGKRLTKSIPKFDSYCDNAQNGAKEVLKNPVAFTTAIIIRFVSLLFYYAIPFYIIRSLDVNVAYDSFFYTILATCFAVNAVVWIPTPGTSGGIEMSFTVLFAIFNGFSGAVAAAAAIIWRAFTYYLIMIISFLEYLLLEFFQKREKKKHQ